MAAANVSLSTEKRHEKTVEILENSLRVMTTRKESLDGEAVSLRKAKATRDITIGAFEKKEKLWNSEKNVLIKERDEVKEEKQTMEVQVQRLEAEKQDLDDFLKEREGIMEHQLREIEKHDSVLQHIKEERDGYRVRAHRAEDDKRDLVNGLKRKWEDMGALLHASTDTESPPAKRPRTPQSAKRDAIPSGPRAMVNGSSDSQRSASMCSPTDTRHGRSKEVCKRKSSQQRRYSERR